MDKVFDVSFEEYQFQNSINEQPERLAYIDEYGSFGFNFSKAGTIRYYILCAVVVEKKNIQKIHDDFEIIKRTNGLANAELKSSKLNDSRRFRIMTQILPMDFRIVLFIVDKQKFIPDTPLTKYKDAFYKHMAQQIYDLLYRAYPKLHVIQDEIGTPDFRESFKNYVEKNRPQLNIFNQYEFDFINSKDEILVQLSDFISGSVAKSLLDIQGTNYLEMIKSKVTAIDRFPSVYTPYWGKRSPEDCKYDDNIFSLAVKSARDFITKNEKNDAEDKKCQVAVLRYLLYYVSEINPTDYVYSDELCKHIQNVVGCKKNNNYLFRRVIAPLRDSNVILASCSKGYKIPVSVDDIVTYMNQTSNTVGPMLHRMGLCRNLIKQSTNNEIDIFDNKAFYKYKRYFDE